MKTPCYECPNRTVGCHAGCADYSEWKVWHDGRVREARITGPQNWESRDILHYSKKNGRVLTTIRKEGRY